MIKCCNLPNALEVCFRVPENYFELLSLLPVCNHANTRTDYIDRSSNLLHAEPVKHDPYTPDSMDSPSPNALTTSGEVPDLDVDHHMIGDNMFVPRLTQISRRTSIPTPIDRAVSPALLKSKLELIVQNKEHEDANREMDVSDIKRSPSECHLRSTSPDSDDRQWCVRKNRCNSDVSWQRSHVLTEAWIRGKGQQGYHSFKNFTNPTNSSSSPPDIVDGIQPDLIIPRIAIINASNFESNDSSLYFHDDRLSNYSENKLSAYSDGRTKTLSGEAASSEKSDEICDKIDDGSNRLCSSTEGVMEIKEKAYPIVHSEPRKERYFKEDNGKFIKDECDVCKETKCQIEAQAFIINTSLAKNDVDPDKANNKFTVDVLDESVLKSKTMQSTEILLGSQSNSQTLQRIHENYDEAIVDLDKTNMQMSDTLQERFSAETGLLRNQDHDSKVIKTCSDSHAAHTVSHDAEIISCCESKQKMCASKDTTRSNSTHSQDISDHAGSVRLKLKAYKVTERYKSNVIARESRCKKCCCVIS